MTEEAASIDLEVLRYRPGEQARLENFSVVVAAGAKVLDALDTIWATQDHSLMFRRACHHSSCGACAMRINGRERLACITAMADAAQEHHPIRVEPLHNLPVVGDLVVDVAGFFARMTASDLVITRTAEPELPVSVDRLPPPLRLRQVVVAEDLGRFTRFESCIECGICVSVCPSMAADDGFLGPAALAGIHRTREATRDPMESAHLLALADGDGGVWRCHSSFECTASCPQAVDPAGRIMSLRGQIVSRRWGRLWRR
ncbi:MAG TPA: 2Fe-2S iron-sulfur cluster-binding protein [Candidatus Nanopelagicaceae bacterium]|nr:2Fe-2S iron-sulfur cluster-binding protein [Candidatus Nanopelagicaceae bacterium]